MKTAASVVSFACIAVSSYFAWQNLGAPAMYLWGIAGGVHLACLMLAFFAWRYDAAQAGPAIGPLTPDGPPAPKRHNFVPPRDGTFDIAVPNGADVAAAVARYAADLGLEAYASVSQGFLIRDTRRKRVYRTRIQFVTH